MISLIYRILKKNLIDTVDLIDRYMSANSEHSINIKLI